MSDMGNNICVDKGITTRFWTGRFIVFTIFTWIFYIVVDAARRSYELKKDRKLYLLEQDFVVSACIIYLKISH